MRLPQARFVNSLLRSFDELPPRIGASLPARSVAPRNNDARRVLQRKTWALAGAAVMAAVGLSAWRLGRQPTQKYDGAARQPSSCPRTANAAGGERGCARVGDGKVFCWGDSSGFGGSPREVPDLSRVWEVGAGNGSCARRMTEPAPGCRGL